MDTNFSCRLKLARWENISLRNFSALKLRLDFFAVLEIIDAKIKKNLRLMWQLKIGIFYTKKKIL